MQEPKEAIQVQNLEPASPEPNVPLSKSNMDTQHVEPQEQTNMTINSARVMWGLSLLVVGLALMLIPIAIGETSSLLLVVTIGLILTVISGAMLFIPMAQH